jgi:hypothetical protein
VYLVVLQDSLFSRLLPQLLALVLARLDPAERLGTMARVCSAWRAAAVMATNSISAVGRRRGGLGQDSINALSDWLQVYAAAAGVDSLTVKRDPCNKNEPLTLPVQQLATLRSLDLDSLTVTVKGQADTQAAATGVPLEFLGITHLRLWNCGVGLSTLPAFTNLQHLALYSSSSPELATLVHLTHLHLSGWCANDAVLAPVSSMTGLQELQLVGPSKDSYTAASFAALPMSLTKLCMKLERCWSNWSAVSLTLAVETTPAIATLTALRWLAVDGVSGFSAALLRDMSSLQHLALGHDTALLADAPAEGQAGGLSLSVLSGLTQLQHLELPQTCDELEADPTAADIEALTASSQLTCLIIDGGLVKQGQYRQLCSMTRQLPRGRRRTENRRLPHLKELQATMGLLARARDVSAFVQCCPNLERLDLGYGECSL